MEPNEPLWRLRRLAIRLGILYIVVAILLSVFSDRFILFPSHDPIPMMVGTPRVEVAGPAGPVEIWTTHTETLGRREPRAFVLEFIGNASRAESTAPYVTDQWRKMPVEVWTANYPGFGGSAGSAKLKYFPAAALAAFDEMKQRAGNRPTFVSGHSIGTTVALYVAAHRAVAGLVLQDPPPLRQMIIGDCGWWNLWLAAVPIAMQVPSDLDSIANARNVSAPAIFIQSGLDTHVPPPYQQRVIDAYAGTKEFVKMPLAHHCQPVNGEAREQFENCLQWLWSQAGMTTVTGSK